MGDWKFNIRDEVENIDVYWASGSTSRNDNYDIEGLTGTITARAGTSINDVYTVEWHGDYGICGKAGDQLKLIKRGTKKKPKRTLTKKDLLEIAKRIWAIGIEEEIDPAVPVPNLIKKLENNEFMENAFKRVINEYIEQEL